MPISGDVYLDANTQRFSLPMDSCVGDDGPTPEEVTVISKGGPAPAGAANFSPRGGSVSTATAKAYGRSEGKSRGQQAKESWIPPASSVPPVKVGYDRDVTTDNNYVT